MHTIRANLYWKFQFVLGNIAVPRSWYPLVVGATDSCWFKPKPYKNFE
jgi:hypothetical protein